MSLTEQIEAFDIKAFLDDRGVEYYEGGKNVTRGWINVRCLFCGDHSNHLGINLKTKQMNCWKCGSHKVIDFIKEVDSCGFGKVKDILSQFGGIRVYDDSDKSPRSLSAPPLRRRVLPPECEKEFPQLHLEYLRSRRFNPRRIIRQFNLRAVNNLGRYKFRIIAPFYYEDRIVAFTGADVTRKQSLPYKNSSLKESAIDPKRLIYNLQNIRRGGSLGVVEGLTDAWRIRENVTATMGIRWTTEQFYLLTQLNIKRLFLIFDGEPDAYRQAKKLAQDATGFITHVEVIELPYGKDPCDLPSKDVAKIRRWLRE